MTIQDVAEQPGRPARLARGIRRVLAPLTVFGPGLVTLNAGNDAGGVTTYSVAGARYGLNLLWALPIVTTSLIVTQEACVRLGAV